MKTLPVSERLESQQYIFMQCTEADVHDMAHVFERATRARDEIEIPYDERLPDLVKDVDQRMQQPGAWAYAAYGRDAMVGFVLGYSLSEANEGTDTPETTEYLALLMTDPEHWGAGIGRRLLECAADKARQKGKSHMFLWTDSDNEASQGLYEKMDYERTHRTKTSSRGTTAVHYLLRL